MANKKLSEAKNAKNDEFYTQYEDIQREVNAYLEYNPDVFRGKTILLPCDDPEWSNFTRFFAQNFENFGLKKLISTSFAYESKNFKEGYQLSFFETESPEYDEDKAKTHGKIFTLTRDSNKSGAIDIDDLEWHYLAGDGDFRSDEVKALRDEADIIVTNPPFSLYREFIDWLFEEDKQFLVIANKNSITYKEIFPLIMKNKMWSGRTSWGGGMWFETKDSNDVDRVINGVNMKNVSSTWFTNIEHGRRHQPMSLMTMEDNIKFSKHKEVNGKEYCKYVTFDALDVPYSDAIPKDYKGMMGVPKSFLEFYCAEQFELLGYEREDENIVVGIKNMPEEFLEVYRQQGGKGHYTKGMKMLCYYDNEGNAKIPFSRILIRYTDEWIKSHPEDFEA